MGVIRKLEHIAVMQVRDQSDILSINPYQHQTGHGAMVIPDSPYWFLVLALYRILTKQSIQIMQIKEKKIYGHTVLEHTFHGNTSPAAVFGITEESFHRFRCLLPCLLGPFGVLR